MAPRSTRSTKSDPMTDESNLPAATPDAAEATGDESTGATATTETLTPEAQAAADAEAAKIAERKAYAKARRERIKAEQEAAGLVLKREYTTADGSVFTNRKDAAKHIAVLKFRELISSNPLTDANGYAVPEQHVSDWLHANRKEVQSFLRMFKD
jgi:hypothetical protein